MIFHIIVLIWTGTTPQQTTPPTSANHRLEAYQTRLEMEAESPFTWPMFENVGPVEPGGRVSDVEGYPDRPHTFRASFASGGLWCTQNHGTTWTPLFDRSPSISIGDFVSNPKNWNEIWVGTGEKNASRSSYAGTGVYFSSNGGQTWEFRGLADTHHISRILIHPHDPKIVYVAAIGHLYSPNSERGVFRTRNRGETWEHILFINDSTGVIDLAFDPENPDRLYAAAWQRSRYAWDFLESGPESGVYITTNGGDSWQIANHGLPDGPHLGRMGIAVSQSHPNIVYLSVDNQAEAPPKVEYKPLTRRKLKYMTEEMLLSLSDDDIESFLRHQNFHADYTAKKIKSMLRSDEIVIKDLLDYMEDGNAALFEGNIVGAEVYRSDDYGAHWTKTHKDVLEDVVYSYGYYFGEIRVSPTNPETIYLCGVPLLKSVDGGKTFVNINEPGVHVDHQAMWLNPINPRQILLGNDGGVYLSYDEGNSWQAFKNIPVGQFYTVAYDHATPYRIYGGLQDNGVWRGLAEPLKPGHTPWELLGSGDGAFVAVDPRDNETVYWGYQFGHYTRLHVPTGDELAIFPRHKLKQPAYRFNWMTPVILSRHHPDVLYMGAQYVLRSLDRGASWKEISPDLTTNPTQGDVPFGTITTLRESTHEFGTLIAGTDDGRVWYTRGGHWTDISAGLPRGLWVSSLEISSHDPACFFATTTGYRNDDFSTYVFMSRDYGQTWQSLKANLPNEPCNVIRQDNKKPNILYLGTDLGIWISIDAGNSWIALQNALPHVPVYAIEIQPEASQLIAATHGRSVFVLDLSCIRQVTPDILNSPLHLFPPNAIDFDGEAWGSDPGRWWGKYDERPTVDIAFTSNPQKQVLLEIHRNDQVVVRQAIHASRGINRFSWDFQPAGIEDPTILDLYRGENGKFYVKAGTYSVKISEDSASHTASLTIRGEKEESPAKDTNQRE